MGSLASFTSINQQHEQEKYEAQLRKLESEKADEDRKANKWYSKYGGAIGTTLGAVGGGALGSLVAPGIGTGLGASAGAALGGLAGNAIGKSVSGAKDTGQIDQQIANTQHALQALAIMYSGNKGLRRKQPETSYGYGGADVFSSDYQQQGATWDYGEDGEDSFDAAQLNELDDQGLLD